MPLQNLLIRGVSRGQIGAIRGFAMRVRTDSRTVFRALLVWMVLPYVVLAGWHDAAATSSGTAVAWGCTGMGIPTDVCAVPAGLDSVVKVAAADDSSLTLSSDGSVAAWGCDVFPTLQCSVPVAATSGVVDIAGGDYHSLAAKNDGTVVAWGCGSPDVQYGQCTVPGGLSGITQVAAGYSHSLALSSGGAVTAWGCTNADFGQCTVPPGAGSHIVAIAAGEYQSLALNDSGGVIAWGCGSPTNFGQCTVPVGAQSGVTAIAGGWYHSVALKSDGTVVAWGCSGATNHGQCSVPAGLTGVVAISAGEGSSVALKTDGAIVTWGCGGTHDYGQCTVPGGHSYSAIAAGHYQTLAVQVPAPTVANYSAPPLLQDSPFSVSFTRPVMGVDASDFTVVEVGPHPVSGAIRCLDGSNNPINCSAGPVTVARLVPSKPLRAGEHYFIDVNPSSQGVVGYPDGEPVAAWQGYVRAQTFFTSAQYPLRYTWGAVANASAVGGSYLEEQYASATESFSFSGTSLDLIMWAGPDRGKARVTITTPGQAKVTQTIDTYRASSGDKTFSWPSLVAGKHTVRIAVTGARNASSTGTWVGFDAGNVDGAPFTPKLAATWSDGPGFGYVFTGKKGASVSLSYRGTGVTWNALVGPNDGKAKVTIDGVAVGTIDLWAPGFAFVDIPLSYSGIADTVHVLKITALGTKRSASSDTVVTLNSLALD